MCIVASFPGSPEMWICIAGENLVSFVCKYDVTEIGLKQKAVLCVVQSTLNSTLGVCDI